MYVMQITGTGAVKPSASSTRWQLWQQDNERQLQPQTRTRARKCELANTTGQMHTNKCRQMQSGTRTWTRTGKHRWGRANEHKREQENECRWMRAREWEQANMNEGGWVWTKVGEKRQQQQQQRVPPPPFLFIYLVFHLVRWQPSHSIPPNNNCNNNNFYN